LVKRRLREISRELMPELGTQLSVVVRALPGSAELEWNKLREELINGAKTALKKANG
jgi:ribonuclease P protein component